MALPLSLQRALREFRRFSGDGLPGEPANAPLPIGDPASGIHNPSKAELRAAIGEVAEAADSAADRAEQALADSLAMIVPDEAVTEPKLGASLASILAPVAANRAALRAMDPSRYRFAILGEEGQRGIFAWRVGNYADAVVADSAERNYIKADGISASAGAWVRLSEPQPPARPGFAAHKNGADQGGLQPNTTTKVTFGAAPINVGGHYDSAQSRWTPPAGPVVLSASVYLVGTNLVVGDQVIVTITKNGTPLRSDTTLVSSTSSGASYGVTAVDLANGTDYYEVAVYPGFSGAGNRTVFGGIAGTFFQGYVLGAEAQPSPVPWALVSPQPPGFPPTVTVIRGSGLRAGRLVISTGGSDAQDAQIWIFDGAVLTKFAHFDDKRCNFVLPHPTDGSTYFGLGSQNQPGAAFVGRYDAAGVYSQVGPKMPGMDIAYAGVWHGGRLHVATGSEATAGSARVYRLALSGTSWEPVFAPGVDGLPSSYSYTYGYELLVFGGKLHVGCRSPGDVWRKDTTWTNLGRPTGAEYALAATVYEGEMVWGFAGAGTGVFVHRGGAWVRLGAVPSGWAGITLWNSLAVWRGQLYVGVGGPAATAGVWRYDAGAQVWVKVAGGNIDGSWSTPPTTAAWVYRLEVYEDELFAGLSSDVAGAVGLWKLSGAE